MQLWLGFFSSELNQCSCGKGSVKLAELEPVQLRQGLGLYDTSYVVE